MFCSGWPLLASPGSAPGPWQTPFPRAAWRLSQPPSCTVPLESPVEVLILKSRRNRESSRSAHMERAPFN